jgi:hypothetical protein
VTKPTKAWATLRLELLKLELLATGSWKLWA